MENTYEIRFKLHGNLVEAYKKILASYHTDTTSLLRAYIVELAKGAKPLGYPRRVVIESEATAADTADPNTLIIPDHMRVKFPEFLANELLNG
jgi:hypothetical protein